jgi:hypothetical protein
MKRSERKNVKTDPDERHAQPNQTGASYNERHISGGINVRGEIEAKRPPDLTQEHRTERNEDQTSSRKKFVVEIATLIVVTIYAGLTFWQACTTQKIANLTKKTYETSQRPYIGVNGIAARFDFRPNDKIRNPKDAIGLQFQCEIKNFGPVPGTNFSASWKIFFNGQEQPGEKIPDTPSTLYPTETANFGGAANEAELQSIRARATILESEVNVEYDGPTGHTSECVKYRYEPSINVFFNLGKCTHPK